MTWVDSSKIKQHVMNYNEEVRSAAHCDDANGISGLSPSHFCTKWGFHALANLFKLLGYSVEMLMPVRSSGSLLSGYLSKGSSDFSKLLHNSKVLMMNYCHDASGSEFMTISCRSEELR